MVIIEPDRAIVLEGHNGISEVDPVLAEIRNGLPLVPLIFHAYTYCMHTSVHSASFPLARPRPIPFR